MVYIFTHTPAHAVRCEADARDGLVLVLFFFFYDLYIHPRTEQCEADARDGLVLFCLIYFFIKNKTCTQAHYDVKLMLRTA
jgi:hypothetical protein